VKWQSSASTTCTGFHPFCRLHVPYVCFVVICFTSADDIISAATPHLRKNSAPT
jgi:hypothetical protein